MSFIKTNREENPEPRVLTHADFSTSTYDPASHNVSHIQAEKDTGDDQPVE
jgi:hypothetical protein